MIENRPDLVEEARLARRHRLAHAAAAAGAMVALLFLDGQLGPASFTLRRAATVTVLAVMGAARVRGLPQWRVAAVAVAALALPAPAPSVPLALVAFVIGLAAMTFAAGWRPGAVPIATSHIAACLSYVGLRFAMELVPQAAAMPAAAGRLGSLYIDGCAGSTPS